MMKSRMWRTRVVAAVAAAMVCLTLAPAASAGLYTAPKPKPAASKPAAIPMPKAPVMPTTLAKLQQLRAKSLRPLGLMRARVLHRSFVRLGAFRKDPTGLTDYEPVNAYQSSQLDGKLLLAGLLLRSKPSRTNGAKYKLVLWATPSYDEEVTGSRLGISYRYTKKWRHAKVFVSAIGFGSIHPGQPLFSLTRPRVDVGDNFHVMGPFKASRWGFAVAAVSTLWGNVDPVDAVKHMDMKVRADASVPIAFSLA